MKAVLLASIIFTVVPFVSGQGSLAKVIETERAFAARAAEKGTKHAFLEYLADDGILFLPDRINGKAYWNGRSESQGLLSWAPNYADVSANGMIGYTTGNWEFRAKGKDDTPSGFGQFVTIWQRGQDGRYKFVLDIGIGHENPERFSTEVIAPSYPAAENALNSSSAETAAVFFESAGKMGAVRAYDAFLADEVRGFREGSMPILGKKKLLSFLKKQKSQTAFAKRSVFFGAADIAYVTNTYTRTSRGGQVENGNFVQIWKLINGKWQIVLDIFKPVPPKQA